MWIAKPVVLCEARDGSLDSTSCEAKISALHRAKPRLSHEAKATATLCAERESTITSLKSRALLGSAQFKNTIG